MSKKTNWGPVLIDIVIIISMLYLYINGYKGWYVMLFLLFFTGGYILEDGDLK